MNRPARIPNAVWMPATWLIHFAIQAAIGQTAARIFGHTEALWLIRGSLAAWLVWEYANILKKKTKGFPITWTDYLDGAGDLAGPMIYTFLIH